MSIFVNVEDRKWESSALLGLNMDRCLLWAGAHEMLSGFFRMPAGMSFPLHRHEDWVHVLVMEGKMEVKMNGGQVHEIRRGGYCFVELGDIHIESSVEDSLLLVVTKVGPHARISKVLP